LTDGSGYDVTRYERPSVTVDIAVFTLREGRLQVLLVQRKHWPHAGMWALPGGFVHMDESLEDAARRELAEETGVRDPDICLEQVHAFGEPDRDPRTRVITVAYCALISSDCLPLRAGSDAAAADWFSVGEPLALAFDHADILGTVIRWLRAKIGRTSIAFHLLPGRFTLAELQEAYEQILGQGLDGQSFRRQMLASGTLEETSDRRAGDNPPVRLYRYRPRDRPDPEAQNGARWLFP
jgi:8-oxo-dGTP diphosphatase